jgi:DNA-binding CsgD family transcriptional regulator
LLKEYDLTLKLKSPWKVARVLANVALVLEHLGEFELAVESCEKAIQLYREQGTDAGTNHHPVSMLTTMCHLLALVNNTGGRKQYARLLAQELDKSRTPGHWAGWATVSEVLSGEKRIKEARRYFAIAKRLCPSPDSWRSRAVLAIVEAELLFASGQVEEAKLMVRWVCDAPLTQVGRSNCYVARKAMSRYVAIGSNENETRRWVRQAEALRSRGYLENIFSERLRLSIREFKTTKALTEKELMCLSLSARGQTSADIGIKLGITPRTVNFHFSKILKKLEAMNRQEAIAKAITANLIEPPYN